ncbi:MAG: 4Fe-4S dicluster domain-containing protein [Candidatus Marinimicrobia bacterium]|nr:4Fe-4S dicluster domain-containing protein [Candidatus Neomarinimicrobiota bacterium]MCH8068996.1 4Fe-4S dicluster domain-containing protein [Candidatus Neomarinimicrobiota bacterium]
MPSWGMVIDLNKCTGCAACVSACRSENNVPNVGPEESQIGRALFWMDIVEVVEGEYPDVRVQYIPRPCFHCENPPCTKVCPVRSTYKNNEGLVAQIYHRCIGCRYCMVACPYTVKSFNWYEPERPEEFLQTCNPDVSLRMKGVVEKCSFCSHRLQHAREQAKFESRALKEADYQPACKEACPTSAIVFGDFENENHEVYRLKKSNRAFRMQEDLGTEPKVVYLSRED